MPADPLVPSAAVVLDQERHLVEDFGALALTERRSAEMGMPINTANPLAMGSLNAQQTAIYLWALLRNEDPAPSLEQVQAWYASPGYGLRLQRALRQLRIRSVELAQEANPDLFKGEVDGDAPLDQSDGSDSPPSPEPTSD